MADLFIQNKTVEEKIQKKFYAKPHFSSDEKDILVKPKLKEESVFQEAKEEEDEEEEFQESVEKRFSYLENVDSLIHEFNMCENNNDVTKKWEIYFCGFKLSMDFGNPYVNFLMFLDNGKWNFPNEGFFCATNIPNNEDGEQDPLHVYFENFCTVNMLKYLDMTQDNESALETMFKGIYQEGNTHNLYVFFDISNFPLKRDPAMRKLFVSVDELVNRHECLGFEIQKHCYKAFYKEKGLFTIFDQNGEIQDVPTLAYLCNWENGSFKNVYSKVEEDQREFQEVMSLIDERIDHPILGNFYYFSLKPFEYHSSVTRLRRFLLFTHEPVYLLKPINQVQWKKEPTNSYTLSDVIPSIVDYFSKKDEEKKEEDGNIETKEEQSEEKEEENKGEVEEKEDEEDILENKEEDLDYIQFKELLNDDSSSLYFLENVANSKKPFWCMKNRDNFVEI